MKNSQNIMKRVAALLILKDLLINITLLNILDKKMRQTRNITQIYSIFLKKKKKN